MKTIRYVALAAVALGTMACGAPEDEPLGSEQQQVVFPMCGSNCSSWVYPSAYGTRQLIYVPDDQGDHIADTSHVGYKQGRLGLLSDNLPSMGSLTLYNEAVLSGSPSTLPPVLTDAQVGSVCSVTPLPNMNPVYDHQPWIQAALDYLADQVEDSTGVRGRLYLSRGHYALWNELVIRDGVVLRGVSESPGSAGPATTLHACGRRSAPLITIGAPEAWTPVTWDRPVQDELVPSGSNSLRVTTSGTGGFVAGVPVRITRFSAQAWLHDIGMDTVYESVPCTPGTACDVSWQEGETDLVFDRLITRVEPVDGMPTSKRLFFDQPFTNALELKYGADVRTFNTMPERAANSGVYRLRGVSHAGLPYCSNNATLYCRANSNDPGTQIPVTATSCNPLDKVICPNPSHTAFCKNSANEIVPPTGKVPYMPYCKHSETMLHFTNVEDSWAKEVTAVGFPQSAVDMGDGARWNTVEEVVYTDPVGPNQGGWRYPFSISGSSNLVVHCGAREGRHDFVPGGTSTGPTVFLESDAEDSQQDSGPHQTWATGALFDNITLPTTNIPGDFSKSIHVRNRYNAGSGHGWTGSSMVVWNSTTNGYRYYNPPTGQNWLIGSIGKLGIPNECYDIPQCPSQDEGVLDPILKESEPHFDFKSSAFHGTHTGPLSADTQRAASLYRSAAEVWTNYPEGLERREYFVGDADDFGNGEVGVGGDTNDAVFVNPAFQAYVAQTLPTQGFDSTVDHRNVPFSIRFDLADGDTIVHAYLAVRIKRIGAWTQDDWHKVQIAPADSNGNGFADDTTSYLFSTIPANMTGPLGFGVNVTPVVRVIDLYPRIVSLASHVIVDPLTQRRYGELNVNFYRRTRVDWASLTLVIRRA